MWARLSYRVRAGKGQCSGSHQICTQNSPKKLDIWKLLREINPAYMQHEEGTGSGRIEL